MQRWVSIVVGVLAAFVAAFVTYRSLPGTLASPRARVDGGDGRDARDGSAETHAAAEIHAEAGAGGDDAGDGLGLGSLGSLAPHDEALPVGTSTGPARDGGVGFRLTDGTPVPPLPAGSPRAVRFGVILVQYKGAEGAPSNARPKHEAEMRARELADEARTNFTSAVGKGDAGSSADMGRIPRGVLEPAPEYVLFTLAAGNVSDPIDTPRGFWIVKRVE
jgi:hypothetical protein